MKNGKYGCCIVGTGVIAPFHAKAIEECAEAELVAVCDIEEEVVKEFAGKYGNPRCYTDFKEVIADEEVDIVCVCTPSGLHKDVVVEAANRGKHIYCEKPLDISVENMDAIAEAVEKNNVKCQVVFQRRTWKQYAVVKKAVSNQEIGTVTLASLRMKFWRSQSYYDSASWRGTWALDGGGVLMNQGVHGIDILLYMLGDVKSVIAYADHLARDIEVEDTAVAILKFENGAFGVVEATTTANPEKPVEVEIHGDLGTIYVTDEGILRWCKSDTSEKLATVCTERQTRVDYGMYGHTPLFGNLVKTIKGEDELMIPISSGRKAVDLILAIYESSREKKEVVL